MELVKMPALFRLEKSWGLVRAYPECDYAISLMGLAGTKTLLPRNFKDIETLGFVCIDQNGKEIDPKELY
jgi:hypothetical protein